MRSELPRQRKVVLTSSGRELELPICEDELKPSETLVATNANVGQLYIKEYKDGKKDTLHDRDGLSIHEMASGEYNVSFISLPLIDHYLAEKERLKLENEKVRCSLQDKLKIVKDIEKNKL